MVTRSEVTSAVYVLFTLWLHSI